MITLDGIELPEDPHQALMHHIDRSTELMAMLQRWERQPDLVGTQQLAVLEALTEVARCTGSLRLIADRLK